MLWLDFSEVVSDGKALRELIVDKAGLWLDDGVIFGGDSELFERINIACPRTILSEALNKLKKALEEC